MSGPKVAQVLAGAEFGGAEKFYTDLSCALAADGRLVQRAFTRPVMPRLLQLRAAGIEVETHRLGGALGFMGRLHLQKSIEAWQPDAVLTWMSRASSAVRPGRFQHVCRLGHYYDPRHFRHADHWIGNTKGICDYLVRKGFPAARVHHLPNFADETPTAPVSRALLDTPRAAPLVLAAGRLHPNKGFDLLLAAMAKVPDAWLWLAGAGPLKKQLQKQTEALQLQERVRFLGWRNDVTALMRTADIFVCPSRHEGLGTTILEAWAHQCPVIATASEGPRELLQGDSFGITTRLDEAAELAAAIRLLLKDPQQRHQLAERARQHYLASFARQQIVARYAEFFTQITRQRSRAGGLPA